MRLEIVSLGALHLFQLHGPEADAVVAVALAVALNPVLDTGAVVGCGVVAHGFRIGDDQGQSLGVLRGELAQQEPGCLENRHASDRRGRSAGKIKEPRHWLRSSRQLLRRSGATWIRAPSRSLMRSLLSQYQTPASPRRFVGFFGSGRRASRPALRITQLTSGWQRFCSQSFQPSMARSLLCLRKLSTPVFCATSGTEMEQLAMQIARQSRLLWIGEEFASELILPACGNLQDMHARNHESSCAASRFHAW